MMIFSPVQIIKESRLILPYYIRAAMGLHNELQMHLSVFQSSLTDSSFLTELIASPIPLELRSDLWIMKASFHDRPGLMADLTSFLKNLNIDIVSCFASTSEHNKYCSVELVLDNQFYSSDFDGNSGHRSANEILSLDELEAKIMAYFIEDILFSDGNIPLITIYRNIPLYRSKHHLLDKERVRIQKECIKLPRGILQDIEKDYLEIYPQIKKLHDEEKLPLATIVVDAENTLLKILIFYRNTGHLHARIRAKNEVGTLAEIASRLKDEKFNIYQMYTRSIDMHNSYSYIDLLLKLPPEFDKFKDDDRLKKFIRNVFSDESLKRFEFEVLFPKLLQENKKTYRSRK